MKYVVVGGVAGGATFAARLRRLDKDAEIVIYEKGPYISYANCGLPYYVGDVIKDGSDLLLNSPQIMKNRFNIDVFVNKEVKEILAEKKELLVYDKLSNKEEKVSYDKLVLATGSSPFIPNIDGIDDNRIFSLWTVPDALKIKKYLKVNNVKKVAVIGGGFIGVEMAHNLKELGLDVSLIEKQSQVLNNFDFEMSQLIHNELVKNKIKLLLNKGVIKFEKESNLRIILDDNSILEVDLVILAIGVMPNSKIGTSAGIEVNGRGGIIIDDKFKTSIPDIYALGDVVEVTNFISQKKTMIPLAGPANKQGRMLADIFCGFKKEYNGSQATSIIKVFDLTCASTGLNEKELLKIGKNKHQDYEVVLITQKDHAGYYPNSTPIYLKMLFDIKTNLILGAQVIGYNGVDKRIDVLATAIRFKAKCTDLQEIDLAYAPPYSQAKDAINMLGFVSENILNNLVKFIDVKEYYENKAEYLTLDVRMLEERKNLAEEDSVHIPYDELRKRHQELDKNSKIAIYCAVGIRAYNAARILVEFGFHDVFVIAGGIYFQNIYKQNYSC